MLYLKVSVLALTIAAFAILGASVRAGEPVAAAGVVTAEGPPPPPPAPAAAPAVAPEQENPIPPYVENQAIPSSNGGYCYGGPHPAPGGGWEASQAAHVHDYAPFDLRLFAYHDGCYYFVGDPRDFGFSGQTYSYYGAHPILDAYGGGWCFMIGAHSHWWRPWSPYFTVVGPWNYWYGPFDPFFWAYWPYYSFYYRSYYPSYYAGGRFYQTWRAAPPITRVPATGWRGTPSGGTAAAGGWRGSPAAATSSALRAGAPAAGGWRGGAPAPGASAGGAWRGGSPAYQYHPPAGGGSAYQYHPPAGGSPAYQYHPPAGGGWHGGAVPYSAPRSAPSGGGFHFSPGFRGGGGGGRHR